MQQYDNLPQQTVCTINTCPEHCNWPGCHYFMPKSSQDRCTVKLCILTSCVMVSPRSPESGDIAAVHIAVSEVFCHTAMIFLGQQQLQYWLGDLHDAPCLWTPKLIPLVAWTQTAECLCYDCATEVQCGLHMCQHPGWQVARCRCYLLCIALRQR